jgi:hypothetical protein
MAKKLTMADVIRINEKKGRYFFSPDTMKFFNSRIESDLIKNKYFVTSEKRSAWRDMYGHTLAPAGKREFSIRKFNNKTGRIDTIGDFGEFGTKKQALKKIKKLI